MIRPGDLTGHSDFHLFKEGIKPMWEVGVALLAHIATLVNMVALGMHANVTLLLI